MEGSIKGKKNFFPKHLVKQQKKFSCTFLHLIKKNENIFVHIIGHYNPSVRLTTQLLNNTYVECVNFIHKWRGLQFKVNSERQICLETFHGNFIYSKSFCQKSAERKTPKKYFLYFFFDVWPGARTLSLRLISQHTTYCLSIKNITEYWNDLIAVSKLFACN